MSETFREVIRSQHDIDGILLNAMHAAQNSLGYLSDDAIDALTDTFGCSRAALIGTATYYGMLRLTPPATVRIQICKSAPCHVAGARAAISAFEAELGVKMGEKTADGKYSLEYVECLGQCQTSPTVIINGKLYANVTPERVKSLLRGAVNETRIVLRNMGKIDPGKIEDYITEGGYAALKKARTSDRKQILEMLESSGKLRGRGGAAFNTGTKWSSAFAVDSKEKYIICNADEGEPGTYKDRIIIENDPHTVIEGMLICAWVIGAKTGYIYCRGEYTGVIALLEGAIRQAEENGFCGETKLYIVAGAGSYVCGEETALIESLEGARGEPRLKTQFPSVAGFRGKPTVVNNVETFATVPCIVEKGAEWFSRIGADSYPGTKVFSLSGDVVNRSCFELATDVTLRQIVEDCGGGVAHGRKLKAVQVGGSSCAFLTPDMLDIAVDFDSMRSVGASLGSGAVLVIDDSHNMADIAAAITSFFAHESCGKCSPCREGTLRVAQLTRKIADGNGTQKDLDKLKILSEYLPMNCFCPSGQSATTALASAMKLFPQDFDEKLQNGEG